MLIVLWVLWIIFAGSFSVLNAVMGLLVSAGVTWLCRTYMGVRPARTRCLLQKAGKAAGYFLFLLKEIFLSNVAVIRRIYTRGEVEPRLVHLKTPLQSEGVQVLYANSITLTPGTFTVEEHDGEYWVHALDKSLSAGIEDSEMLRRLTKLEEDCHA